MKIPKNLKHADYVDLIKEINQRSLMTSEKVSGFKKSMNNLKKKLDIIIEKLNNLEKRYCDLVLQS